MAYNKTILTNGIRVITIPKPDALSVSFLIMTDVGAKNEKAIESGFSHFLEHMCFKGTTKRPRALDITSEFDSLGANYNAFTGHDFTAYYATVIPDKTHQVLDIIADIYQNPVYESLEIEKEKGVVIEEIKLYEDKPTHFVWDVFMKLAYGNSPQGQNVLGTRETINELTKEDLVDFRHRHYLAGETAIAIVGKFNEEEIIKLLEEKFSNVPAGERVENLILPEDQNLPRIQTAYRDIDQTHLVLGFRSFNIYDERIFILNMLAGILGGGMSSRLWQKVREEMGAAYYVGASQNSTQTYGNLALYAGVDAQKSQEVISVMLSECQRLKEEIVEESELQRVKDSFIGNLYLGLETPSDLSFFYGEQEALRKDILSPEDYAEKIRAVTAGDVQAMAREIFIPERLNLAIVGPERDESAFLPLLKV